MSKLLKFSVISLIVTLTTLTLGNFAIGAFLATPASAKLIYQMGTQEDMTNGADLLSGWDFTNWVESGTISGVDANSYTSTGAGGIYNTSLTTVGKRYRMRIAGTISASYLYVGDWGYSGSYTGQLSGTFDETFDFTAIDLGIYLRNNDSATTDITKFELYEIQTADLSGNNHKGSLYQGASTGWQPDQNSVTGIAYDFDGADTKIDTSLTNNSYFTSGFTVSAWINPATAGEGVGGFNGRIVDKSENYQAVNGFSYLLGDNNSIRVWTNNSNSIASANNAVPFNTWTHVIVTVNSASLASHYVNGIVSGTPGTLAAGITSITTSNPLLIGNTTSADRTFDGSISDVRVYEGVLTAEEVADLYKETNIYQTKDKGVIASYDFSDENLKSSTIYSDTSKYTNDGTVTAGASAGIVADQNGQNRAYDFDGADTTIPTSLTSNTGFTSGFTLSAWINPDTDGEGGVGRIIDKTEDASIADGFVFYFGSPNRMVLKANGGSFIVSPDESITLNQWQHVLVTVASDATVTHYINGVVSGTPGTTGALSGFTTSNPLTIGNRSSATDRTFNGSISDVKIFNYVLSAEEVVDLYKEPAYIEPLPIPSPIASYSLDRADLQSSTVIADISGNGNNGTITAGASAGFVAGHDNSSNSAYDFDGSATFIDIPDMPASIDTNSSISLWVKPDVLSGTQILIGTGQTPMIGFVDDTNLLGNADGHGAFAKANGAGIFSVGEWTHIVVTYASDWTPTYYLNGSIPPSGASSSFGSSESSIGKRSTGDYFNGSIDEVRVYNKVLSTTEINQLYNMGVN